MTTGCKRQGQSPPEGPDLGDTPAPTPQVTARRPGEPSPPRSGRGPRGERQVRPQLPRPRVGPGGLWARVSAHRTGGAGTPRPGGSDARRGGLRAAGVLPPPPPARPVRSGRQVGSTPRGSPARARRRKRKRKRRRGARRLPTAAAPRPAPPRATRARRGAGCGARGHPGRRPRGAGGGALLTRSRAAPPATPTGRQGRARAGAAELGRPGCGATDPAVRVGGARGAGRGGPGAAGRSARMLPPHLPPGGRPGEPGGRGSGSPFRCRGTGRAACLSPALGVHLPPPDSSQSCRSLRFCYPLSAAPFPLLTLLHARPRKPLQNKRRLFTWPQQMFRDPFVAA